MRYIKIPAVYKKLKKAEELFSPVLMTAAGGWGKSAAVEYFYRRKKPLVLCCKGGSFNEMPPIDSIRANIIIVEDLQWLTEEDSIQYLKKMLRTEGMQVVMLTRGAVPKYFIGEEMELGFVRIMEPDFMFGEKQVEEFFSEHEVEIHSEDIGLVTVASRGYAPALLYYVNHMRYGQRFSEGICEAVWQDVFRWWDGVGFEQWPDSFCHFALSICQYDDFSEEMAEYLTGNPGICRVIEYCRDTMHQLIYLEAGRYSLREEIRKFFCWKQKLTWSREAILENYSRGGNYYEIHNDIPQALKYYKLAGDIQRVKELLVRNVSMHPGVGHYVETKEYYFDLPREQILESPVLMAGMSMLHDLLLQPEKSEIWYQEVIKFEKNRENIRELRRDARTRIAYLDIALPHRGTKGILRILRNAFIMITKGDVVLPEMCVTGNLPSIMNGGLDFCEWSKNDTQIAKFMKRPIENVVGKYGKGLVTIALAESGFEKGTMSSYEVLTRCSDGYEAASHGGKAEMCFVSLGIQTKQHIIEGQIPSAKRLFRAFEEKVEKQGLNYLRPNMEAFQVWISLFEGLSDMAIKYEKNVPDALVDFCTLDRYPQMIKLRCLIAENKLQEALALSNFLTGFFSSYERHMNWMENEVLKGIVLYRIGDEHWKNHIISALKKAAEYHFVRVISLEGAAVLPLLRKLRDEEISIDVPPDYLTQVAMETEKVAGAYPDYLKYIPKDKVSLTKRESEILSMLCSGMTTDEICKRCKISYDGLKKHNRNIYKKLGAKNRAEAERRAIQLGLVYRGKTM